jgi:peroxiredoxin family protein
VYASMKEGSAHLDMLRQKYKEGNWTIGACQKAMSDMGNAMVEVQEALLKVGQWELDHYKLVRDMAERGL